MLISKHSPIAVQWVIWNCNYNLMQSKASSNCFSATRKSSIAFSTLISPVQTCRTHEIQNTLFSARILNSGICRAYIPIFCVRLVLSSQVSKESMMSFTTFFAHRISSYNSFTFPLMSFVIMRLLSGYSPIFICKITLLEHLHI